MGGIWQLPLGRDSGTLSKLTKPALVGLLPKPCLLQALTLVVKMFKVSMLDLVGGEAVLTFLGTWYPLQGSPRGSQEWCMMAQERPQRDAGKSGVGASG